MKHLSLNISRCRDCPYITEAEGVAQYGYCIHDEGPVGRIPIDLDPNEVGCPLPEMPESKDADERAFDYYGRINQMRKDRQAKEADDEHNNQGR